MNQKFEFSEVLINLLNTALKNKELCPAFNLGFRDGIQTRSFRDFWWIFPPNHLIFGWYISSIR